MQPGEAPARKWVSGQTESLLSETHHAAGIVYFRGQDAGKKELPPGWTREALPDKNRLGLADEFRKADAEFLRSPKGQLIVSFRGTAEKADWKANLGNIFGVKNEKYEAAAKIGEAFKNVPGVVFTGHSLGGGLAKLAGEVASTGPGLEPKTVVGFNAAPVTPATYRKYGVATNDHLRTTIHVVNENDILNRTLKGGKLGAVNAKGLFDRERPDNSMIVVAKGEGSIKGATGHGIKNFVTRGDSSNIAHFTAPLNDGIGSVSHTDYERFRPNLPERGRSGIILGAARSAPALAQSRQQSPSLGR
jgi:hypothetical protein